MITYYSTFFISLLVIPEDIYTNKKFLDGIHPNSNTDHSCDSLPVGDAYSQLAPSRKNCKSAIQLMYGGYAIVLSHNEKFSLTRSSCGDHFLIFFENNFVQKPNFFQSGGFCF